MLDWLKTHWLPMVAVLLAAGGGYVAGRYCTAPRVEVRTETKTEWKDREVVREVKVQREKVFVDRVVYRTVETHKLPSGEVTTKVTERSDTDTHKDTSTVTTQDKVTEREGQEEKVKVVTPVLAQWRVGVDIGGSLKAPLLPLAGPLVLGARVERRILGPVWGGVWASTYGAAGVGVTSEF